MALLSASGLEKSYGTDTILGGVSFEILRKRTNWLGRCKRRRKNKSVSTAQPAAFNP